MLQQMNSSLAGRDAASTRLADRLVAGLAVGSPGPAKNTRPCAGGN
jgi:hypothetical protein